MVEVVGPGGLEPPTPRLSSACSNQLSYEPALTGGKSGKVDGVHDRSKFGADRIRTDDVLLAKQVLYQLSYGPGKNQPDAVRRPELLGMDFQRTQSGRCRTGALEI